MGVYLRNIKAIRAAIVFFCFSFQNTVDHHNYPLPKTFQMVFRLIWRMCQNLKIWFGRSNSDTFIPISQNPMHIFQNRFLRWNPWFKPFVLRTMNPIIRRVFFWLIKGSWNLKSKKKIAVTVVRMKIWNIPHVQNIKRFHFFTTSYYFSWKCIFN